MRGITHVSLDSRREEAFNLNTVLIFGTFMANPSPPSLTHGCIGAEIGQQQEMFPRPSTYRDGERGMTKQTYAETFSLSISISQSHCSFFALSAFRFNCSIRSDMPPDVAPSDPSFFVEDEEDDKEATDFEATATCWFC